ncbi:MAG: PIN domain-containing protein [Oscillospiraceae bacterium]|jgi:predicted nucleic acid-binding protein|nr:PIN domain-containing protein [Oscillospiraceae bacterium]
MNDDRAFLDTNILIYIYQGVLDEEQKIGLGNILEDYDCIVSTQVLNEFSNIALKKLKFNATQIKLSLSEIRTVCRLHKVGYSTVFKALDIQARYGYHYYDCLMIASALEMGCDILFSEDMADGQIITSDRNLTIKNPFN